MLVIFLIFEYSFSKMEIDEMTNATYYHVLHEKLRKRFGKKNCSVDRFWVQIFQANDHHNIIGSLE